jgi:ATP-binding protein involved in chromosome partitioning
MVLQRSVTLSQRIEDFQPDGWPFTLGESQWLISVAGAQNVFCFKPPFPCPAVMEAVRLGWPNLEVDYQPHVVAMSIASQVSPHPRIRNLIAVSSAKGGVGKSSVTVNLATALVTMGARVGILDADVYGPSIPLLLGIEGLRPGSADGQTMEPLAAHGLVANSIGFLQDVGKAAIWRGPMASKALTQIFEQTHWPELDYLLIDMPPGTGDIQLTLAQQFPVNGALVVTTAQALALRDAHKGIDMFHEVGLPVLGLVENMSYLACECGQRHALFGEGGTAALGAACDVALLGQLPFSQTLNQINEAGENLQDSNSSMKAEFLRLAESLVTELYFTGKPRGDTIAVQLV